MRITIIEPLVDQLFATGHKMVLTLLCVFLPTAQVHVEQFNANNYMLVGNAKCVAVDNNQYVNAGDVIPFFVAVTQERILVGWGVQDPKGGEIFNYISEANTKSISIEMNSSRGNNVNMLHSADRRLGIIVQQNRSIGNDQVSRVAAAQMAVFGNFTFAVFFSSDYLGVNFNDIVSLLSQKEGRASSRYPCGELKVLNQNGLHSIEFSQEADDIFTNLQSGLKLRNVKFKPFESGLQRTLYTCVFDPPLTSKSKAPWTAECTKKQEGLDGKIVRVHYKVTVEEYSTDLTRINGEIDKVLGAVPEGSMVVTDSPVSYIWKGGRVERKIDLPALKRTEKLRFQRGGWSGRLFIALNVLIITALVVVIIIRFRRRRHS